MYDLDRVVFRATVFPFQKCVNYVSRFVNSVFYRFRNSVSFFSSGIFGVNDFGFQHSFSFYSVTVLR